MRVVASYLVLVELGNGDSSQNADDRNYDQQFYECEAFYTFMSWMFLYYHSPPMVTNGVLVLPFILWDIAGSTGARHVNLPYFFR